MKLRKWFLPILAAVLILCVVFVGIYTVQKQYVRSGDRYFLRNSQTLDLRDQPLTVEEYRDLSEKIPQCSIRWNVPIGEQLFDSHARSITLLEIHTEQIPLLQYLHELEYIELGESITVAQWSELQKILPQCRIHWAISLGTRSFSPMSEYLHLNGTGVSAEELETKLSLFPSLKEVKITDTLLSSQQRQLLSTAYPNIRFQWHVAVDDCLFLNTATHISLDGPDVSVQSLIECADQFEGVRVLDVAGCGLSAAELLALKDAFHAKLEGNFVLFDRVVDLDVRELDLSGIMMEDTLAVEQAVGLLPQLEKVIMCDCGIDSEAMDAMGQRHPEIKFVWNVRIGKAVIRTDETSFISCKFGYWPVGGVGPTEDANNRLFDQDCVEFKYCRDMIALDMGHMALTDISFLKYMPKLQYLILADNPIEDFSALQYVPNLVFLEIFMTSFDQAEVLTQLKDLKALNIGYSKIKNWEPLMEMTWLDRLWIPGTRLESTAYWQIRDALPNTEFIYRGEHSTDHNWRDSDYYRQMRDLLGMPHLK